MAQRPQPSLRLADGGSFITRWAQSVMRPGATAKRLREADAPPPAPAPAPAPPPPPPPPNATPDNPAGIRFQDGGHVPGTGRGDKIPAKYEPGEFVVSNDMIDDNPGLREQLSGLRAETLAARGKTVEEADAKALRYHGGLRGGEYGQETRNEELPAAHAGGRDFQRLDGQSNHVLHSRGGDTQGVRNAQVTLRAVEGFGGSADPDFWRGNPNPLQGSQANQSLLDAARQRIDPVQSAAAQAAPEGPSARPTAPLPPDAAAAYDASPEGRATKAQALKDTRGYFQGNPSAAPTGTAPPANTPSTASKWFGAADDWKKFASGPADSPHKSGRMTAPGAPGWLGKAGGAVQGVMGAKNAYDGIQEGDAWKAGVGAADAVAGAALFTPAAPVAGAYLGLRGAWDTARTAGGAIYDNLSEGAKDTIGGWANQIALNTGLGGVNDDAKMQLDAAAPTTLRKTAPGAATTASATTPRTRPEDAFAGPPESARSPVGDTVVFGSDANPGNVTRNGNEYSGTNVRGDITVNGFAPGAGLGLGSGPNAQNMAAANNLAATDSLRSQGAALSGQLAGGSGVPAMPQTLHSGNDWASRKNLENLRTSASSIYDSQSQWGNKAKAAADVSAYQNAQAMDTAARTGSDPGSVSRTNAQASMFGSKTAADASRYGSDNSLRGQMYSSDAQLGAKRMEMERGLRQQQLVGEVFRRSGGDPVATARALAGAGLTDAAKSFQDMAGADQTRTQNNVKDARSTFENMFTRDGKNGPERDENGEALAHQLASQIVPGWENMSAEQRAANRTKVVEATRMVQGMNSLRNNGIGQRLGIDDQTPAYSQLPDMNGAVVGDVGWWDGMTTPGVSKGDKRITLRGGQERYLPQGSLTEAQLRILQENGARPQK
ncbi:MULTISPECIES: hypothetical protein [unclassified Acidovorax]|uniref:hypothetical protein n=1 Tax=unclassified Acidovorax TaxID=2684926 RepID=UPI0012FA60DC|nr:MULTISPECIES: hypothetical protein [unclassified Acidovorax]